jgi:aspartyl/asparaginyl-tRNA synthetase
VTNLFRTHLNSLGFIEIHSPKLQGAATESGASVFEVNYFKGKAFLATWRGFTRLRLVSKALLSEEGFQEVERLTTVRAG